MTEPNEQILYEIKELKVWLYGSDGFTGDIPEIKAGLKDHNKRIRRIELIVAGLVVLSGGIAGAANLLGG